MKHSWLERADGTATCRRCPAVRRPTSKLTRVHRETVIDDFDNVVSCVTDEDWESAIEVTGAHPTKCGRPA